MGKTVSLYGRIALDKAYCDVCKGWYFVLNGVIQCCDKKVIQDNVESVKRECNPALKSIPRALKDKILRLQEYRCYLCGVDLSELMYYRYGNSFRRIVVHYDHFIPKAFCVNNDADNIYAMCNLCNKYKSSKVFESREEARDYVLEIRKKRGNLEVYSEKERDILRESMP